MYKSELLMQQMKEKKLIVGTHVTVTEPSITELMGNLGFDFVWIEGEHSPLDKQAIQNHIIAAKAGNTASFVRIPWNDPVLAKPILEMGPDGIIFPFIRTKEEAELAVASCRYPPKGIRGFGPRRANRYGTIPINEYINNVEKSFLIILQIEHIDAVNNLEEILSVEGIDTIVVGPNDLSGSIGLLGQTRHPEVMKLFDKIAEKSIKAGVPFGVSMGMDKESLREWVQRGVSWIGSGNESSYIVDAGGRILNFIRSL